MRLVNGLTLKWVESHFRSKWKGVIIDQIQLPYYGRHNRKEYSDCLIMVIIFDKNGKLMKRKIVKRLSVLWTTSIPPIDVNINCDWLSMNYKIARFN